MLRISKLTDYATVILARLAAEPERRFTAGAARRRDPPAAPTVSKLLKQLHRRGLVHSTRGLHGGYLLARPAAEITAAQILDALEGPVALTECAGSESHCGIESTCLVGHAWQRVNLAIRRSLQEITLLELAGPERLQPPSALDRGFRSHSAASLRAAQAGAAMSTPDIDALVSRSYRHGFVTDIESDTVPPGLDEGVVRLISRKKGEPQFLLDWRLRALRHWQRHARAALGAAALPADRLRGDFLLLGAQAEERRAEEPGGRRSEAAGDLREARRAAARARAPGRRRGGCGVRQRLGGHHLQGAAVGGRGHLLPVLRGGAASIRR